jgi:hypothetical protein
LTNTTYIVILLTFIWDTSPILEEQEISLKKSGLPSVGEQSLASDEDALCQLITTQVWLKVASLRYAHSPKSLSVDHDTLLGVKVCCVPGEAVWLAVRRNLRELGADVKWSIDYPPETTPPSDWTGQVYARLVS